MRPEERNELFIQKLQQCRVEFDFNDASSDMQGKQIKAQTLNEMLDYITNQRGVITEEIYPEVVGMVSRHCTALLVAERCAVRYQSVPVDTSTGQSHGRCI